MTQQMPEDWTTWLRMLQQQLTRLEAEGQQYLTLPADPELAAQLRAWFASQAAAGAEPGTTAPNAQPLPGASAPQPAQAATPSPPHAGQAPAEPPQPPSQQQPGQPPAQAPGSADTEDPGGWRNRLGVDDAPPPTPDSVPAVPPAPANPAAAGNLESIASLESLQVRFRDCQACKLGGTRQKLVFGAGSRKPGLMFIGEGPGADEDASGLPFVGRAGAVLTAFILALGLSRDDVFITNAVKCRPPGNRNPEPDELSACRPILERQIALLNPKLIVTLGNVPLKLLKPKAAGITRERGRMFDYGGRPVLPTFHPSYLLRSPEGIGPCWADFRQAMRLLHPDF